MARLARILAVVVVASGVLAPAASGAATKIVVNTTEDVAAADANEALALAACGGKNGATDGRAAPVGTTATTAETTVNTGTPDPAPDVRVTPCSFRLALLAANASANAGDDSVQDAVGTTITFDKAVFDRPTPPLLGFEAAPLPPILDPALRIDGCAGFATKTQPGPCVNVEVPETGLATIAARLAGLPGSLAPPSPYGLAVMAPDVAITGLAFHNGDPAIWVPPMSGINAGTAANGNLSVTNSYFGLDTRGEPTEAGGLVTGIQVSGNFAKIGIDPNDNSDARPQRNVFAQGDVGVLIAGASGTEIEGNWFGTGHDGRVLADPNDQLRTGVRVVGLGADVTPVADALGGAPDQSALAAVEEAAEDLAGTQLDTPGVELGDEAEERGAVTVATRNKIGDSVSVIEAASPACDGPCNLFVGLADSAVDVGGAPIAGDSATRTDAEGEPVGATTTLIKGNRIGVDAAGTSAGTENAGIVVRNGSTETAVGGELTTEANVISHSGEAGVAVLPSAGRGTKFGKNTGTGNGDPIFDLGGDGPGNEASGPSAGIQAPAIGTARPGTVAGTARAGDLVRVYRAPLDGEGIESFIASDTADGDGRWAVSRPVVAGERLVATAERRTGTSELTDPPATVVAPVVEEPVEPAPVEPPATLAPPPAQAPSPGPPPPPPPADAEPPRVIAILGAQDPQPGDQIVASRTAPIGGRLADSSGVREVRVAFAVPPAKRPSRTSARRVRMCSFVNVKRARVVRRRCARPLFFRAQGTDRWKLPLSRRTRTILTRARFVTLYLAVSDTRGNTQVRRFRIKFGKTRRAVSA